MDGWMDTHIHTLWILYIFCRVHRPPNSFLLSRVLQVWRLTSVLLSAWEPFSLISLSHRGISVSPINSIHSLTGGTMSSSGPLYRQYLFAVCDLWNGTVRNHIQTHIEKRKITTQGRIRCHLKYKKMVFEHKNTVMENI